MGDQVGEEIAQDAKKRENRKVSCMDTLFVKLCFVESRTACVWYYCNIKWAEEGYTTMNEGGGAEGEGGKAERDARSLDRPFDEKTTTTH